MIPRSTSNPRLSTRQPAGDARAGASPMRVGHIRVRVRGASPGDGTAIGSAIARAIADAVGRSAATGAFGRLSIRVSAAATPSALAERVGADVATVLDRRRRG